MDWLLFKNGIRKPTRLRVTKGKNQAGEEGNTIDLRWLLRPLRHPGTLNQIKNSEYRSQESGEAPISLHSFILMLCSVFCLLYS